MVREVDRHEINDEYRKGSWEGKHRIAGLTAPKRSEDEIRGLLVTMEAGVAMLRVQLNAMRKERKDFELKAVK